MRVFFTLTAILVVSAGAALAKGDLATRGTKLPELVLGEGEAGFGVSHGEYRLETGKLYELTIKATGRQECALRGEKFFSSVYLRKVEAGGIEIKAPFLTEIEFENAGEAGLFFVPVRTGKLTLGCAGLESRGLVTTFTFE